MREAKGHFFYVDWLRGGAAFLVFAYHARNLLFLDAGENPGTLSLAGNIFYFITGFGHVAVVVFFVLSGCVIARAVVPALEQGSWSWASYLVARVTRLWVVLLPGLLLTLACDALAWRWFPTALPHTAANYGHMLTPADHAALSGPTFMGNAFFLQTILVPCFGSNGALWSLANEFWYYLIFPLGAAFFWGDQPAAVRVVSALVAAVLLVATGAKIAGLFPVWLLGVGVFLLWRHGVAPRGAWARWGAWGASLLAAGVLAYIRAYAAQGGYAGDDLIAGGAVALAVFFLLFHRATPEGLVNQVMRGASNFSFTLYVVHTPVLVLIASYLMNDRTARWPFDAVHVAAYLAVLAAVTAFAYGVYRLTEARTPRVRAWVGRRLGFPAAAPQP